MTQENEAAPSGSFKRLPDDAVLLDLRDTRRWTYPRIGAQYGVTKQAVFLAVKHARTRKADLEGK